MNPIKINLGCGKKYWDDYINVDANPDVNPDIITDFTQELPFENDYADEIIAIHLIEHIDKLKIDNIIQDWFRVLKPGGKLIIECPDLEKIAHHILNREFRENEPKLWETFTIQGIFGEQTENMLTIDRHMWGYTPDTMADLLLRNNFKDVMCMPAQWHRPQRDMRFEATKL